MLGGLETYHSVFFLGTGAEFYQQLKLDFLDTLVKALNIKILFYNCLLVPIRLFNFS